MSAATPDNAAPKRRGRPAAAPAATPAASLLDGLPPATPAAIAAARETAGHSQEAAARLVGLAGRLSWWRCEAGKADLEPARWAIYLLTTDQHPALMLKRR